MYFLCGPYRAPSGEGLVQQTVQIVASHDLTLVVRPSGTRAVATIGSTEVGRFLNDPVFTDALIKALGTADDVQNRKFFDRLISGATESGVRTELGVWDLTSRRLVESASGAVRTITPFSPTQGVYAQVEMAAALANDRITSINGISRELLLKIEEIELAKGGAGGAERALNAVIQAVDAVSYEATKDMRVGRVLLPDGSSTIVVDSGRFFEGGSISRQVLPPGAEQVVNIDDATTALRLQREVTFVEDNRGQTTIIFSYRSIPLTLGSFHAPPRASRTPRHPLAHHPTRQQPRHLLSCRRGLPVLSALPE